MESNIMFFSLRMFSLAAANKNFISVLKNNIMPKGFWGEVAPKQKGLFLSLCPLPHPKTLLQLCCFLQPSSTNSTRAATPRFEVEHQVERTDWMGRSTQIVGKCSKPSWAKASLLCSKCQNFRCVSPGCLFYLWNYTCVKSVGFCVACWICF